MSQVQTIKPRTNTAPADNHDESGLDNLNPQLTPGRDAKHFRRIIAARKQVAAAEDALRAAVQAARDAGDSWTVIGMALGTTRQAAFQRFGK
nr:hypothetical protein [Nocardia camponoti]